MTQTIAPVGEYVDRKRTLPKRIVPISLHLTSLQPGRHVVIIDVNHDGVITFETAVVEKRKL